MRIDVLTLFPEMFAGVLGSSILKRAAEDVVDPATGAMRPPVCSYHLHDIRRYTDDKHGKVDKPPYGGGPGMVMQCQPVWDAVQAAEGQAPGAPATRVLMSPQGEKLTQGLARELAKQPRLLIIAGHYEGIDQRAIDALQPMREISIGDYVLTGGELPAMVLIDTVVRLLPGALGDEASAAHESFSDALDGLLDYPHYTRPPVWAGREAPQVLMSGDHEKIRAWRQEQAARRTQSRRPDLLGAEGRGGELVRHRLRLRLLLDVPDDAAARVIVATVCERTGRSLSCVTSRASQRGDAKWEVSLKGEPRYLTSRQIAADWLAALNALGRGWHVFAADAQRCDLEAMLDAAQSGRPGIEGVRWCSVRVEAIEPPE